MRTTDLSARNGMDEIGSGSGSEGTKKETSRLSRREALKRIASAAGPIGVLAVFPALAWGSPDKEPRQGNPDQKLYAAYYCYYGSMRQPYSSMRYVSHYSSYKAPSSYSSYRYSSYGSTPKSPGATCFIDTLEKKK
jgi:hypothetical protein